MRTIAEILQEGIKLVNSGQIQEAQILLDKLLCMFPEEPEVMGILGAVYARAGLDGTAMSLLTRSVELAEENGMENGGVWCNLGAVLKRHNHYESAKIAYETAIKLMPDQPGFYSNYSGAYINTGEPEKAEQLARKAISLESFINIEGQQDKDITLAKHHLSLALLEQGKWSEAWTYYDYRKTTEGWQRPQYAIPEWKGQETGTLVIHGEQGLGDEVMYCSLIEKIRNRAKRIIIEASPRLVSLMRRSLGLETFASMEEIGLSGVKPDHIIAMGSLPLVVGLTRKQAMHSGYLKPDYDRHLYWSNHLRSLAGDRPIIGIAWTGGVQQTHKAVRNPPREMFKQFDPKKYFLVSVQYTPGAKEQAEELGAYHNQQAIDDIDEQCALISNLDCLVTVAQTAMHFSGGMGVPTIALVSSKARWDCIGENEGEMPWWKSIKVIRQEKDDWQGVFTRAVRELESRYATPSDIAAE